MLHTPHFVRVFPLLAIVLALFAGSSASAWDGKRALVLAERLDVEIASTVSAAEGQPSSASVRDERHRGAAMAEVPALQAAVTDLLNSLRSGGSREASQAYYERVQMAMDAVISSVDDTTPRKATLDRWAKSSATLRELGRLYAEE